MKAQQRADEGPFAGKVLVQRADADARAIGNGLNRRGFLLAALEHLHCRFEDGIDRLFGAQLAGQLSRLELEVHAARCSKPEWRHANAPRAEQPSTFGRAFEGPMPATARARIEVV